jgi:hypothetical protein
VFTLVSLNSLASQIIIVDVTITSTGISFFCIALFIEMLCMHFEKICHENVFTVLRYDSTLEEVCTDLCSKWLQWDGVSACPFSPEDIKNMSSGQVREFLAQLLEKNSLSLAKLQAMENTYKLNSVVNSEIRFR